MDKIVFLFPGVGSQYVGMGKDFFDNFDVFRRTFEEAGDISALDFPSLCFSAERKEELNRLENAQVILLTMSVGIFRVYMQEIGVEPHYCMGHSLGEYSALCCAGVIPFASALELVKQRGAIITGVSAGLDGTMMWVINLEQEKVVEVCRDVSQKGSEVYISAYDSPTQTSISGHNHVIMKAAEKLQDSGAIVYPLKMSGPFHSPLMREAAERMKAALQEYKFEDPLYTVIANRNAELYKGKESVIDHLSLQLVSPIRWQASIDYLVGQGVTAAVEMGPKDVLKFLMKKNTQTIQPFTMDNNKDLEALKEKFLFNEGEYLQLMGKCLGAAVSTKNRNEDMEVYEREVVKPYMEIAGLYERLKSEGKTPTLDQVNEALRKLRSLLEAKKVPAAEQQEKLEHIFAGKVWKSLDIRR